jgi:hypothetical protein
MRKQNEQVMEFIKQNFWWAIESYKEKKFWKSLEVLVRNNAFKIYMYKTCLVSYSDISKDVWFDNGWYETTSTAQNLKAFVEEIFDFIWIPRWGWIETWRNEPVHKWEWWKIYIDKIKYLYL